MEKVIRQIKNIKIQGANDVAIAGINFASKNFSQRILSQLISARPTEPLLVNSLKILEKSLNKKSTAKKLIEYIEDSEAEIAHKGSNLIKNNMNIFSHCHSSTVIRILKYAKKQEKKNFVVYTLEVDPLKQGRKTARELANAGIKVIVFPDLAAEQALKKCDLFLFGADAFLKKGVVNKIGTSLLCKIAKTYKIPRYSCGVSLKYISKIKIEKRKGKEVWDERNKNIDIENPSFDLTKRRYLSGSISEFGITSYKEFLRGAKNTFKILMDVYR